MSRSFFILLVSLLPLVVLASPPAAGQDALAFTLPVPCDQAGGASTGVALAPGNYVVTVVGACVYGGGGHHAIPVSTPCEAPAVGPIPCTTQSATVPDEVCLVSVSSYRGACSGLRAIDCAGDYFVSVDGQCLGASNAGVIHHAGGPVVARFVDGNYADNRGVFLVTLVWTPT